MGIIKQGILGGFSGKVGSVVGTSWKGRAVMKAMPLSVANPRTTGQVTQRNRMTGIVHAAQMLLGGTIALCDNPFAGNISGYNRFVKRNVGYAQDNGTVYANAIKFSEGALGNIVLSAQSGISAADDMAHVSWTSQESPYNLPNDRVIIAVVNSNLTEVLNAGTDIGQRDYAGFTAVALNRPVIQGESLYIIAMAVRADKKYCSNSDYENVNVSA